MTSVRDKRRRSKLRRAYKAVIPVSIPVNTSSISEFYSACRDGDLTFVQEHLSNSFDIKCNPNCFESMVQSTPLHAASYYGHKEIVQLLLQYGCDRSQINSYGLTAYEEAANEEIRQLFRRPPDEFGCNRFRDESIETCFIFVELTKELLAIDRRRSSL